ncbi:MAG TPA: hypothetical protein VGA18_02190 [Rhodothermales bacterium]
MRTGSGSINGVGKLLSTTTEEEQPVNKLQTARADERCRCRTEQTIGMSLILRLGAFA